MGRYGIDYVSVREAAEALAATGETVTVEKIRLALGSGSFTTLGRHLRTWRRTQDPAVGSDDAVPGMINDAAQAVWANLSRAAEQRIVEAQSAAQTAVAAAQEQAEAQVQAAQQELAESLRAHALAHQHQEQRWQEAKLREAALEAKLQATEQQRQRAIIEGQQAEATVQQLKLRLEEHQANQESLRKALAQAQAHIQTLDERLSAQARDHSLAVDRLKEAYTADRLEWVAQRQILARQLDGQQQTVDRLRAQYDASQKTADKMAELAALADQARLASTEQHTKLLAKFEGLSAELLQVSSKVAAVEQATSPKQLRALHQEDQLALKQGFEALKASVSAWAAGQAVKDVREKSKRS